MCVKKMMGKINKKGANCSKKKFRQMMSERSFEVRFMGKLNFQWELVAKKKSLKNCTAWKREQSRSPVPVS